jgi:hypothetical protein
MKEPKNRDEEIDDSPVDTSAREAVQDLDSYKDYLREVKGDGLNFGDY